MGTHQRNAAGIPLFDTPVRVAALVWTAGVVASLAWNSLESVSASSDASVGTHLGYVLLSHLTLWILGLAGMTIGAVRLQRSRLAQKEASEQLHKRLSDMVETHDAIERQAIELARKTEELEQEVDQRRRVERKLMHLARAVEASADMVVITDTDGVIEYVNPAFTTITGYSPEEAVGENARILQSGKILPETFEEMWSTLTRGEVWTGRLRNKRKPRDDRRPLPVLNQIKATQDDGMYWAQASISPVRDEDGRLVGYVSVQRDVTTQVEQEEHERAKRVHSEVRASISKLLQEQRPLNDRLRSALKVLLELDDLRLENKAGMFLKPEHGNHLELQITVGEFSNEFMEKERCIEIGDCLCGRVLQTGELRVSDDCFRDPDHEHSFEGMTTHGHYIVPVTCQNETLGVMFLYTEPYPSRRQWRLDMLREVGSLIGLAVANDRLQRSLTAARHAAEEADRTKSAFLANMSHEIRSPMTAILGYADLLGDAHLDPEAHESVRIIKRNGEHLLTIINDILDISKIEAGKMGVELIETDPVAIVSDVVDLMRERAESKGLRLEVEFRNKIPETIHNDPTRLRQILLNLVGNAIKFTDEGHVRIVTQLVKGTETGTGEEDGKPMLRLDVLDTGIGMSPEQMASLFQPFTQADSTTTRKFGGTGLGLVISRRLTELLGGHLTCTSTPGKGSCFTATIDPGDLSGVRMIDPSVEELAQAGRVGERANTKSRVTLSGRILLAEDGPDNQRLISHILRKAGAEVEVAGDGRIAVDAVMAAEEQGKPFDLILMDVQMPVLDGYAATRELRERGCRTPIVALTAHAMDGHREQSVEAGCDGYITKPIDRGSLIEQAHRYMSWAMRADEPARSNTKDDMP